MSRRHPRPVASPHLHRAHRYHAHEDHSPTQVLPGCHSPPHAPGILTSAAKIQNYLGPAAASEYAKHPLVFSLPLPLPYPSLIISKRIMGHLNKIIKGVIVAMTTTALTPGSGNRSGLRLALAQRAHGGDRCKAEPRPPLRLRLRGSHKRGGASIRFAPRRDWERRGA